MSEKMTTSEPTTVEIVRALRDCNAFDDCTACRKLGIKSDCRTLELLAADRLESQEREIAIMKEEINRREELHHSTYLLYKKDIADLTNQLEKFKAFLERYAEQTSKKYVDDICAITARAEQAECERDALLTDFSTIERDGLCEVCFFGDSSQISKEDCMEDCCFNYRTRRGLPQEGEGK